MSVVVFTVIARRLTMVGDADDDRFLVGVFSSMDRARAAMGGWLAAHKYCNSAIHHKMYVFFGGLDEVADAQHYGSDEAWAQELGEGEDWREAEAAGGFYLSYRGEALTQKRA